jgi:FkbM family methyltransferase
MFPQFVHNFLVKSLPLFGTHRATWTLAYLAERIAPLHRVDLASGRHLLFSCDGPFVYRRAQRLLTKEPDTIQWLDAMPDEAVLWDVGANIGVYSLYAALKQKVRVVAFEPEARNFLSLVRSVSANGFQERVMPLNLGIGEATGLTRLYLTSDEVGAAEHALSQPENNKGGFKPMDSQSVLSYRLDDLAYQLELPFPSHIKIDVDGFEEPVLKGGQRFFADPRLKSVQIELSHPDDGLFSLLTEAGLRQVRVTRQNFVFERP